MPDTVDTIDYDDIAEGVRRFCAERLHELEKGLRPLVDGTFGEVLPGHLAGYIAAIRQLGKLYQVDKPPRALQNLVAMDKVEQLLARMREAHQVEMAREVAAAEARVRAELASGHRTTVQEARTRVAARLAELESRAS